MGNKMTVWYRIRHAEFPQCAEPMVFSTDIPAALAEKVARSFYGELRYILGDDVEMTVWAE